MSSVAGMHSLNSCGYKLVLWAVLPVTPNQVNSYLCPWLTFPLSAGTRSIHTAATTELMSCTCQWCTEEYQLVHHALMAPALSNCIALFYGDFSAKQGITSKARPAVLMRSGQRNQSAGLGNAGIQSREYSISTYNVQLCS